MPAVLDDFDEDMPMSQISVASSGIGAEAVAPAHGDAAADAFELPMPGSDSNWLHIDDSQVPPTP